MFHYTWDSRFHPGYVVFRATTGNASLAWIETHKVALFVTQAEASDYVSYRNEMARRHGTDAVEAIDRCDAVFEDEMAQP